MPIFVLVYRLLEELPVAAWLQPLWGIVGFMFPIARATGDFKYLRDRGGWFRPVWSKEDFELFYIPAWKRMLVCFVSTVISAPIIGGIASVFGVKIYS